MVDSHQDDRGGMCEWLKQAVLKTAVPERVPGVRIPLPPPLSVLFRLIYADTGEVLVRRRPWRKEPLAAQLEQG